MSSAGARLPQLLPDRRRLLADVTTGDPRRTRALDGEIGWAKARLCRPEHYEAEAHRHRRRSGISAEQVADAYTRYEAERARRRLLDFDDLIVACADALAGDADFADSIRWRTRHLFVDEMQDVNPAQFRLLTAMLSDEPDLFVVGDPNQSVYGFNGADPTLLDRLPEILRGHQGHPPGREPPLHAAGRRGGDRRPARRRRRGDREVVPPRRRGSTGRCRPWWRTPPMRTRRAWAASRAKMARTPGRRWSSIAVLTRTNAQLAKVKAAMDAARVPAAIAGADLGPASDLRGERPRRWPRRRGRGPDRQDPAARDRVVLTTFHRAKGLQWPTVLVLGLSTGLMPIASAQTPAAIEEERRLLYVALTRSEDELWCSWFDAFERRRTGARGLGAGAEPVARPDRADDHRAPEGGGADGDRRGVDPGR